MLFKRPSNPLEGKTKLKKGIPNEAVEEILILCPKCKKNNSVEDVANNLHTCVHCGHHFRMNARQRINLICDGGSFEEINGELTSTNILGFPDYDKKLTNARLNSSENEGVITGYCEINKNKAAIFVMEPHFMMGSMGSVVGEKITRLFENAIEKNLPVVGFTVSGGARMQEGMVSLMQMAKTGGAVKKHSGNGNLFLCVLTDPTTGGVTASFAMQGDIIIAEPDALIGFAGPKVIEQTIRKKLPDGFQRAEFLLQRGFVDDVVERRRQKQYIAQILKLHVKEDTK